MPPTPDLLGYKYRMLTVVERLKKKALGGGVLWRCSCECGGEIVLSTSQINFGNYVSCGCLNPKLLPGEASCKYVFADYKRHAFLRNLVFQITLKQFKELTSQNCAYCGSEPSNKKAISGNGEFVYSGVDRLDSSKGYVLSNCVPCCKTCNWMKQTMSVTDFLNHIDKIHNYKGSF